MSEKNEWKPIDSAPKDGSEIIVFHPQAGVCAAFCPGDGFAWHCMDGMNTGIGKKSGQSIPIMTSFVEPPTHWMDLPAAPGSTSLAPGDAQDGLAEAQRLAQALFQRHFAQDDDYASGRVKWEVLDDLSGVLSQIDNMVSGLVQPAAPAAGDALDAARLDWLEQHDGRFYNKDRISSIVGTGFLVAGDPQGVRHQTVRSAIDAAIAASQQQEG